MDCYYKHLILMFVNDTSKWTLSDDKWVYNVSYINSLPYFVYVILYDTWESWQFSKYMVRWYELFTLNWLFHAFWYPALITFATIYDSDSNYSMMVRVSFINFTCFLGHQIYSFIIYYFMKVDEGENLKLKAQ